MKKSKRWRYSKKERDDIRRELVKLSRTELEGRFIAQQEQIQRFLRAAKKLGQSITELQLLGF